jgi:hypothetical protein
LIDGTEGGLDRDVIAPAIAAEHERAGRRIVGGRRHVAIPDRSRRTEMMPVPSVAWSRIETPP